LRSIIDFSLALIEEDGRPFVVDVFNAQQRLAERGWKFFMELGAGECLLGRFVETY